MCARAFEPRCLLSFALFRLKFGHHYMLTAHAVQSSGRDASDFGSSPHTHTLTYSLYVFPRMCVFDIWMRFVWKSQFTVIFFLVFYFSCDFCAATLSQSRPALIFTALISIFCVCFFVINRNTHLWLQLWNCLYIIIYIYMYMHAHTHVRTFACM